MKPLKRKFTSRLWKLFWIPEPRIENWLSSARPKRGRTSTPGTKSSTLRRLAPSDSLIVVSPTTSAPPGTVLRISSRASSVVAVRSGKEAGAFHQDGRQGGRRRPGRGIGRRLLGEGHGGEHRDGD